VNDRFDVASGGATAIDGKDSTLLEKLRLHRARQALRTLLDPHLRGEA